MIKKILLYGLAFGSLSASMVLITYLNKLYLTRSFTSAIPVLGNVVIFGVGVYLLVKSFIKMEVEKPITLGKALLGGLTMAVIAAFFNIGAYVHIRENEKVIFNEFRDKQIQMMQKQLDKETSLKVIEKTQKMREYTANIDENLSVNSFGRSELQMFLSIALIVTLLVYIANQKN